MTAASGVPAYIGRAEEQHALDALLDAVAAGRSESLVVLGEPGVGKTRLLGLLDAAPEKVRIERLVGMESEIRVGFAALHRLLLPYFGDVPQLPGPQRDALLTTFGMLEDTPPSLLLVGLGALNLLAGAAREHPLICVVDDAQWLDQESLGVLGFVARRVYADGIGFVFAARENYASLKTLDGLPTIHLEGLSREEAVSLLNSAHTDGLSSLVAARIVADTGGNPLAMLEVIGQLTAGQRAGRLPLPQQLPTGRGLNSHFLRQVEALPSSARSLLVLASAMSDNDVSSLWRAAALLGLDGDAIEAAVRADLLTVGERVDFRHPLIRSAVYRSAEPDLRRASHAALASVADSDGDPDRAAWHRAAAVVAPDEDVAAELERSAGRAERRGGQVAQALFLGRAAELSPSTPARYQRLLGSAQAYLSAGDGILAEALLDRAAPWLEADGRHVAVQRLRAAIAVFFSRHKDAPAILLEAVRETDPDDPTLIRAMLFDALQAALVARTYTVGVTPADIARIAVAVAHPPGRKASANDLLLDGFATRLAIGYEAAVPLLRDAVAGLFANEETGARGLPATILGWFAADDIWDDRGRRAMFERAAAFERRHGALGALRITLAGQCVGQAMAGDINAAEQTYFEAAEISALIGVPAPATTGVLLEVRAWQGREEESRATAESTARWGREQGAEILEVFSWFGLTVLEMGLGNYSDAAVWASEVYHRDPPGFGSRVLPEIIEAWARTGQTSLATEALERLTRRATASATPWALGVLARSRALLAPPAEAEPFYVEAIERLEQTLVRTELARAHLLYGEWLRRQKRRRDAQAQLRTAHDMFSSFGAQGFAARSRAELQAAGYRVEPERADPSMSLGLTSQEAQAARLAAAGATNAEVAAHMFLTTSTVEYHLSKVYRKLGITSRRQLAKMQL